jgi:hypothetical protein
VNDTTNEAVGEEHQQRRELSAFSLRLPPSPAKGGDSAGTRAASILNLWQSNNYLKRELNKKNCGKRKPSTPLAAKSQMVTGLLKNPRKFLQTSSFNRGAEYVSFMARVKNGLRYLHIWALGYAAAVTIF